jgi:hypothetical protein
VRSIADLSDVCVCVCVQIIKHANNTAFLNLLFRSIKRDSSPARAMAFIKRVMIAAVHGPAPLCAALMLIVSEVLAERPALLSLLRQAEPTGVAHMQRQEQEEGVGNSNSNSNSGDGDDDASGGMESSVFGSFDADKRDPRFACLSSAERSPALFELTLLRQHFHPSVKAFAGALLEPPAHGISFAGDPLAEFGMSAFLDRFAYKNPKQRVADRLQQARRSHRAVEEQPLNMQFSSMERAGSQAQSQAQAPDKHFFFKYFAERSSLLATGKIRRRK